MVTQITEHSTENLQQLLANFNATWMGQGDTNAGTNLLISQALTLANLAKAESGIQLKSGHVLPIGGNLLINGHRSCSLINENVLNPVGRAQNRLIHQLRRFLENKKDGRVPGGQNAIDSRQLPRHSYGERSLWDLQLDSDHIYSDAREEWLRVLSYEPSPRVEDTVMKPNFLVSTRKPRDLDKQLACLHDDSAIVSITLNQRADAKAYNDQCSALLNGLFPLEDRPGTASGQLVVQDPDDLLSEIAPNADGQVLWTGRLLWLVDEVDGPDAVEIAPESGNFNQSDTKNRFNRAINYVLSHRLNAHNPSPQLRDCDMAQIQIEWMAYLQKLEMRLPGITAVASKLPASLFFGLYELQRASGSSIDQITSKGVLELAKWAIERMAVARAEKLATSYTATSARLAARILGALPLPQRDIYRKLSISARHCESLLLPMRNAGIVRLQGKRWELATDAPVNTDTLRDLYLEAR